MAKGEFADPPSRSPRDRPRLVARARLVFRHQEIQDLKRPDFFLRVKPDEPHSGGIDISHRPVEIGITDKIGRTFDQGDEAPHLGLALPAEQPQRRLVCSRYEKQSLSFGWEAPARAPATITPTPSKPIGAIAKRSALRNKGLAIIVSLPPASRISSSTLGFEILKHSPRRARRARIGITNMLGFFEKISERKRRRRYSNRGAGKCRWSWEDETSDARRESKCALCGIQAVP
jgi:hypothetical protein